MNWRLKDLPRPLNVVFNSKEVHLQAARIEDMSDHVLLRVWHKDLPESEQGWELPTLNLSDAIKQYSFLFKEPDIFDERYLDV
jgi:hypothetical protein